MPHPRDFREAGVIAAAEDLNAPLVIARGKLPSGQGQSLVEVDKSQVVVETIKRAEDSDAAIVRLYEASGGRCKVRLRTTLPASRAFLCDLLERDREGVAVSDGVIELELTPFKILTLKLEP
jgi:alpha-mannosidase